MGRQKICHTRLAGGASLRMEKIAGRLARYGRMNESCGNVSKHQKYENHPCYRYLCKGDFVKKRVLTHSSLGGGFSSSDRRGWGGR